MFFFPNGTAFFAASLQILDKLYSDPLIGEAWRALSLLLASSNQDRLVQWWTLYTGSSHYWRVSWPSTKATKLPKANRSSKKQTKKQDILIIVVQRVSKDFPFYCGSGQSLSTSWQYNSKPARQNMTTFHPPKHYSCVHYILYPVASKFELCLIDLGKAFECALRNCSRIFPITQHHWREYFIYTNPEYYFRGVP